MNDSTTHLKDRITADMKDAMRAKATARLSTIRLLLAAIKQREVDERITLDDAQVLAVLEKMLKQRRDSFAQFQAAGRTDLSDQEQFEIGVIEAYLPAQLSADEVDAAIAAAVAEAGGDDIVLLAGKGHEQGQIVGAGKDMKILPFDDVAVARECAS